MRATGLILLAGLLAGTSTAYGAIIDQNNGLPHNASFTGTPLWQQEVGAGMSGQLVGIDVYVNALTSYDFQINLGSPWQTDTNDFATTFTATTIGVQHIDLTPAGIVLASGDAFTFSIISASGSLAGTYSDTLPGGVYAAGDLYRNGVLYDNARWDLGFRTYMQTVEVPEPASFALFVLGGLGLVAARRRLLVV